MQTMNLRALGAGAIVAAVAGATAFAGLPGDECTSAVPAVLGVNLFNTANATPSPNPPEDGSCGFLDWDNSKDVWFVWTPSDFGLAALDFCLSSYDTSVVIYTGTCGNLVRIACDDDSCPGGSDFQSYLTDLAVNPNTTYYIRIGGWQAASGAGQFTLTLQAVTGICVDAEGECGEPHGGIGCNDPVCCDAVCAADPLCCEEGFGWDQACVNAAVRICGIFNYVCTPGGPANDCAPNAMVVLDGDVKAFNTTTANTDGPNAPGCNSASNDLQIWGDLWYRFVAPANGIAIASCCSTANFDTKIAAYDVGNWAEFDPNDLPNLYLDCNEDGDGCENFTSELAFTVLAGRTYLVRLGGYLQETGNGTISFTLPEPCKLPDSSSFESEECGSDANGGCNNPNTDVQQIEIGEVLSGTFWADGGTRDTDWYEFELTATSNVTWSVYSASLTTILIVNDQCGDDLVILATGSGECPRVASVCLQPGTYRAFAAINGFEGTPCGSGPLNAYVASLTAVPAECPSSGDVCADPGPDTATQNSSDELTLGGIACTGGGITTANSYARSFTGFSSGEIRCVTFGFTNSGPAIPAALRIYRDTDGGAPTNPSTDLELLAERLFILPQTAGNVFVTANFAEPICLDDNTAPIVVVLDIDAQTAGFATFAGNAAAETGPTYLRAGGCGFNDFVTLASINFPNNRWVVSINGDFAQCGGGGTPCPADIDRNGSVGATDLTLLLGAWGTAGPGDLDGNGTVGAPDLTLLLGAWGACP